MGVYYPGDPDRTFESSMAAVEQFQPYETLIRHNQMSAAVELSFDSLKMRAMEGGIGLGLGLIEIAVGTLPIAKGAGALAKNAFLKGRISDFAGSLINDHLVRPIVDRASKHRIANGFKLEQNEPPYMFANLGAYIRWERGRIAYNRVDYGTNEEENQPKLQLVSSQPQNERHLMATALNIARTATRTARMHGKRLAKAWDVLTSFTPLPGAEPIIAVTNASGSMLELIPNHDTTGSDAGIDEFIGRLAVEIVVLRQKMMQRGIIGIPIDISLLALPVVYRNDAQQGKVSYTKFMQAIGALCDVVNYHSDEDFAYFIVDHFKKK